MGDQEQTQEEFSIQTILKQAHETGTYRAALSMTASSIPVLAALLSIVVYAVLQTVLPNPAYPTGAVSTLGGTALTLVIWFSVAMLYRHFTTVDRANTSSFEYLINRLLQLQPWYNTLKSELESSSLAQDCVSDNSKREALNLFYGIQQKLIKKRNTSWMAAIGYVDVWRCMHCLEESLIEFEPVEAVIRDALHDEMCIEDSRIENSKVLLDKLRLAVKILCASAAVYLHQPPTASVVNENTKKMDKRRLYKPTFFLTSLKGRSPKENSDNTQVNTTSPSRAQSQARAVIRQVRHELQQYRDNRWENLVHIRNHLIKMTILTGIILYVLCEFALNVEPRQVFPMITTAALLYLVGAIVGLFSRLYNQSKVDTSIDDYQLAFARLMAAPLYSGLAALGGVFIVQRIGLPGTSTVFEPVPANLLVAAVFGLTPSLFTNAIQKEADQNKKDLRSTEAPREMASASQ